MINYADYEFYVNTYKGSLSNDLFNSLILKTSREIDTYVNREITEEDLDNEKNHFGYKIKYTTCLLLDLLNSLKGINGAVETIIIDGVHKTLKNSSEIAKEKANIIKNLPQELTRYI
ncbi:hypothetical protein IKS57_05995 [bacterium]|nr:hypothetical protein [bacterium]